MSSIQSHFYVSFKKIRIPPRHSCCRDWVLQFALDSITFLSCLSLFHS